MVMDKINIKTTINKLAVQLTSFCNLDCQYCYLPNRNIKNTITDEVVDSIITSIEELHDNVSIIWHSGEPLVIGTKRFENILSKFDKIKDKVSHCIQTNGTLISDDWCSLFKKYDVQIGVSIDGYEPENKFRVDRKGNNSFEDIIKGITTLKRNEIAFTVIAVVGQDGVFNAERLYNFCNEIGCWSLGINIVEDEGVYKKKYKIQRDDVSIFWKDLFLLWSNNPLFRVREFDNFLTWSKWVVKGTPINYKFDLLPTISVNGDVVLLSPEFLNIASNQFANFKVGNILSSSLLDITSKLDNYQYVNDFFNGIKKCEETCKYFSFCRGGQASNKYFENNNINSTETNYCIMTKQTLVDTLIETL